MYPHTHSVGINITCAVSIRLMTSTCCHGDVSISLSDCRFVLGFWIEKCGCRIGSFLFSPTICSILEKKFNTLLGEFWATIVSRLSDYTYVLSIEFCSALEHLSWNTCVVPSTFVDICVSVLLSFQFLWTVRVVLLWFEQFEFSV